MIRLFCWLVIALAFSATGRAQVDAFSKQRDFERYAEEQDDAFYSYLKLEEEEFKSYNDSVNREFGKYLAETWKDFDLQWKEPLIKCPVPLTTYNPETPRPEPLKLPVKGEVELPKNPLPHVKTDIPLPSELPVNVPANQLEKSFYGVTVTFNKPAFTMPRLTGTTEGEIATFWTALASLPYDSWTGRIMQWKSGLKLNGWGLYLLINEAFAAYAPSGTENEQVIFTVFTLNQLGYRAKIGRVKQELIPLIAFGCTVTNTSFFTYEGADYSAVNAKHRDLSSVQSCRMEYGGAARLLDMSVNSSPMLASSVATKTVKDNKRTYELRFNRNLVDWYATYPCVDFAIYAEAALDESFRQSITQQIKPVLEGLTQKQAVNELLHFVQFAFDYKTDQVQFGYERWNFAEETVASSYSDCEDRAILFTQLVRTLLDMPVVLISYPGRHLATAVKFNDPQMEGDYIVADGQKYLLCDPTYIGAGVGMAMPDLKRIPIEVIKVK